jgi:glycosyltransferase involved in cell wall biosynthesis
VRVLVVTDWHALEGGVERYVSLTADALRAAGNEVELLTSSAGSAAGGSAEYVAYGSERRAVQVGLQVVNPWAVATVRRALRDFRPDVVHVNSFFAQLSPALLRALEDVPTMVVIPDYKAICMNSTRLLPDGSQCRARAGEVCWRGGCVSLPHYLRDRVRYGIFRNALAHVDRVATISRWMQRELAQGGIAADVLTLPVAKVDGSERRRPDPVPTFAYGGRLAPVKGVDVLLRAFARVRTERPAARLRISGDGPDRAALQRLASELRLDGHVEWDFAMRPDWLDSIGRAWAVVVPSLFREPLGLVAIEAIVRGVPVIASDGGGLAETVEAGVSGTLVPPGDADALADAMLARADRPASVPDAVVESMRRRHDPAAHAAELMAAFEGSRAAA